MVLRMQALRSRGPALLVRCLVFGSLWWMLTEGQSPLSAWGVIAVGTAVGASLYVVRTGLWSWRILPLAHFVPFFLWQSLLGGIDVAHRALRWRIAIRPVVLRHRFHVQQEPARVFMLWVISLLPGTAAIDLSEDRAIVHVLDASLADPHALQKLESRIAGLFSASCRPGR